jgi:hypothetical protein
MRFRPIRGRRCEQYFNTLARRDSEATIRLTSAATLLAKLSVLFLPVSLMTSYFSIQISDLQGIYTSKEYWYAFAGVMGVSFLGVFSSMLICFGVIRYGKLFLAEKSFD